MSSESEPPTRSELAREEWDAEVDKMFLDFCLNQHLHPESTEASVRFEEWFAEKSAEWADSNCGWAEARRQ